MLTVLGLIDVVMIANLLIMVIVGGYETFVSRLNLQDHPDQPEWLSHVNAGVLKVKLATALIGISSIHLLKTFIEAERLSNKVILWQIVIHLTFVVSAFMLPWTDRLTTSKRSGRESARDFVTGADRLSRTWRPRVAGHRRKSRSACMETPNERRWCYAATARSRAAVNSSKTNGLAR